MLPGQWDALPGASLASVQTGAFQVVASAADVHVFSAMAQRWRLLGPIDLSTTITPALRVEDWTTLLRMTPGTYRAYSARLDQYADISFTDHPDQLYVCCEDDVALIVGNRASSGLGAWAYSAETNEWRGVPLSTAFVAECSRFVAGVVTPTEVHGFSARTGQWASVPCASGGIPRADGNVLLIEYPPPLSVLAFSGVRGTWASSPLQHSSSVPQLDHNVALIVENTTALLGNAAAYSAYLGSWVTGPARLHSPMLTANTILLERLSTVGGKRFSAFGANPGSWSTLTVPTATSYPIDRDDDWVTVEETASATLHAFSGVCGGSWSAETFSGSLSLLRRNSQAVGIDAAGVIHEFSALRNAWSPTLSLPGATLRAGHSHVFAEDATQRFALGVRRGTWVAGSSKSTTGSYLRRVGGSLSLQLDQTSGEVVLFHERQNRFLSSTLSLLGTPSLRHHRDIVLIDDTAAGGGLFAASAQRGDIIAAPGLALPLAAAPVLDRDVACVLDSAGVLHAFGAPAATNSFFQYPLETEFQVLDSAVPAKIMVRGNPGDLVFLPLALAPAVPPITLPGIGTVGISPTAILATLVAPSLIDSNGLLPVPVVLPLSGVSGCFDVWTQGFLFDTIGGTVTPAGSIAEPMRFH